MAFWLNLWLRDRRIGVGVVPVPFAILVPLLLASLEEAVQSLSLPRTTDLLDLACDLAGMMTFWWLSLRVLHTPRDKNPPIWDMSGPGL